MCPEEDYTTVVEMLAFDVIIQVGIEETKNHDYREIPITSISALFCTWHQLCFRGKDLLKLLCIFHSHLTK